MSRIPPLFFLSFIIIFLFACSGSEKPNQVISPKIHTLIFIDKTKSVDVSKPFIAQKYQQSITSIIEQNINKIGDKIEVYYIHENTSKARCLSLTSRTETENTEGMNATDQEAAKTNYELSIRKERDFIMKQVLNKLAQQNVNKSNLETNISASIPIISQASQGQSSVKVYYFSDMVESVKNGRDFHIKAPADETEAENWAKTDAEKYKNTAINAEITMILPFEPTSSSKENNPIVTLYWQKLFEKLGVLNIQEL